MKKSTPLPFLLLLPGDKNQWRNLKLATPDTCILILSIIKLQVWISNFVLEILFTFLTTRPNSTCPKQDTSTFFHNIFLYWNCSFFQNNPNIYPQIPISIESKLILSLKTWANNDIIMSDCHMLVILKSHSL